MQDTAREFLKAEKVYEEVGGECRKSKELETWELETTKS